jgi:hypothetical protein
VIATENKCSVCGEPATLAVNVNIGCNAFTPSKFEWRCPNHSPFSKLGDVAAERKACAKLAESFDTRSCDDAPGVVKEIAAAIRARCYRK